jgi:hypothetical protein
MDVAFARPVGEGVCAAPSGGAPPSQFPPSFGYTIKRTVCFHNVPRPPGRRAETDAVPDPSHGQRADSVESTAGPLQRREPIAPRLGGCG